MKNNVPSTSTVCPRVAWPVAAILALVLLFAAAMALAPAAASAADPPAGSVLSISGNSESTAESTSADADQPSVPSAFSTPGTTAAGQDIILGMFAATGEGGTNTLYASYDGETLIKLRDVYKTSSNTKPYLGNHWAPSCPSIMYYNGYFWCLSAWNKKDGKINLLVSYSKDLVHWTHPEGSFPGCSISVDSYPVVGGSSYRNFDIVAPKWSIASDGKPYIVVSCGRYNQNSSDQMQAYIIRVNSLSARDGSNAGSGYLWPNNLRMSTTVAYKMNFNSPGVDFIDGALFCDGTTDYLIIKRGGRVNQLYKATRLGKNPASWQLVKSPVTTGYEGPSIAKLGSRYYLFTDRLSGYTADGVRVTSTTNLTGSWPNPHNPKYLTMSGGTIGINTVRHGSVITLKAGTDGWKAVVKQLQGGSSKWHRLWGMSQFDTMERIVREGWETRIGGTVVVATAGGFYDALSASGVAGLYNAPVLITNGSTLSAQTRSELVRLKPSRVIIAGGTKAVSNKVFNAIKSATGVTPRRSFGNTMTDTAAQLALDFFGTSSDTAILASSRNFHDALSAAPVSYAKHYPIFLSEVNGTISAKTLSAMKSCGIKNVIIVGGTSMVPAAIETRLANNGFTVQARLWGRTQYDTSREIANWALRNGMNANAMGVATSLTYYDALCGAALCGKNNAVLVLADKNGSSNASVARSNKSAIKHGYVFGGVNAVSANVYSTFTSATS